MFDNIIIYFSLEIEDSLFHCDLVFCVIVKSAEVLTLILLFFSK